MSHMRGEGEGEGGSRPMEVSGSAKSEWQKKLLRTQFLVNLAGILERADEALLPGVYRELGLSLHASPTRLGTLTLLRSIVQVLCFPLAAYMSVHHNRSSVIALGAVLWSIATVFVGASSTFLEMGEAAVKYEEEFVLSSRGSKLFTSRWLPVQLKTKALVFLCHGYGMECSIFMKGTGSRLAEAGYAVFGIDYEGHGRSEGRRCYIQSFNDLANDCVSFFKAVREIEEYKHLPRFLYGESMGGAVALLVHRKEPMSWNGAVLVAPMCKIAKESKTHPLLEGILIKLCSAFPTWKIVPTKDVIEAAFKDPNKRQEIRQNPYIYQDRPRLKTALEMLKISMDLEQRLEEVTLPFLVLHGEADKVTDPSISKALFSSALSFDKEMKLYPGMWHGLTSGEPDDNIQIVFRDIIAWLDARSKVVNLQG